MKRFVLLLIAVLLCISLSGCSEETGEKTEQAYAVLTDEGSLVFFRSTEEYENNTVYDSVKDISGYTYSGKVFGGIETYNNNYDSVSWYSYADSIKTVRVSPGQTIAPIKMSGWFSGCRNLESFSATGFDTSNVITMDLLFYGCRSLTSLDLSSFDTRNVTGMAWMFINCVSLESLDISSYNTSKVKNMDSMFLNCNSLISLTLGKDFVGFDSTTSLLFQLWTNGEVVKTTTELYREYPANAEEMAGTWTLFVEEEQNTVKP